MYSIIVYVYTCCTHVFLAVVCTDLFVLDENISNFSEVNQKWIYWNKMTQMTRKVDEIFRFKATFELQPVISVQKFIETSEVFSRSFFPEG